MLAIREDEIRISISFLDSPLLAFLSTADHAPAFLEGGVVAVIRGSELERCESE
jgi:hypothetical protein